MTKKDIAWKKVDPNIALGWKPQKEGEELIGLFLGSEIVQGEDGEFISYHVRIADGRLMGVSGASLEKVFDQIPMQTNIRVVYLGMKESKKKRMFKNFDVFVVPETTLLENSKLLSGPRGDLDSQAATA